MLISINCKPYHSLTRAGEMITSNAIKNNFLGKVVISHTLLEAIKDHNQNMKALVGKDYAAGTLRRFEVLERHVIAYLLFKYNKSDLGIKEMDHEFISGFDFYLRTQKENTTNTAVKHLKNLGKIVRICLSNQWISSDPFFGYKLKTKSVHREYLTEEELRKIEEKRLVPKDCLRCVIFLCLVVILVYLMQMYKSLNYLTLVLELMVTDGYLPIV